MMQSSVARHSIYLIKTIIILIEKKINLIGNWSTKS